MRRAEKGGVERGRKKGGKGSRKERRKIGWTER